MKHLFTNKDQRVIKREEKIDLSRASYSEELSSSSMDSTTQAFHVTIDKILFKNPVTIVQTILEAHGYSLNLENILACVDDLYISVMAEMSGQNPEHILVGRRYLPCLQFRLPNKLHVGPLLKQFYSEIDSYEQALKGFREDQKASIKPEPKDNTKAKLETLERENQELKDQIQELKVELQRATQATAQANKALTHQNLLPPSIRLATVRELDFQNRSILLKAGRTNLHMPFLKANQIPAPGERCLIHIEDACVKGGYFFESHGPQLLPTLAKVLHIKADLCKVRDSSRRTLTLQAKNESEQLIFSKLKRHSLLLLFYLGDHLLRVEELTSSSGDEFVHMIQEQLAHFQIYMETDDDQSAVKDD